MAGLCEGGNEAPGSLKAVKEQFKYLGANNKYKEWTLKRVGTFDVAGPISMTFKPNMGNACYYSSDSAFIQSLTSQASSRHSGNIKHIINTSRFFCMYCKLDP
ncbi:hypothetical protein ANN_26601 [Periplaneta americana]|uniref:Uncharacterized protein n=1 Tax=Periplaneta americana TaxID=6978 RepID=A0ABQ8RYR3_PERAM|nr:hypothetical protein ANN_26601 [Periplaneta americana]